MGGFRRGQLFSALILNRNWRKSRNRRKVLRVRLYSCCPEPERWPSLALHVCGPSRNLRQGMVIVMVPDVRVTLGETACT